MWELDYKESWGPKNWCFWTVVLEKILENPLDCKEIQPVHPKLDQSWIFIIRTDAEAETLILWPPDAKSWLIRKDPDARKDWGQEVKGMTEDEMVLTQWTWVWVNVGSWWWTGRPGVLRFMGSQRIGHDWANELNWTARKSSLSLVKIMISICYSSFISPFGGIKCQNVIMHLANWWSFPGGGSGKNPSCQRRKQKRCGSIPGLGRFLGLGNGNPLQ